MKELNVTSMLNDCEFGEYLKLAGHFWMRIDADVKTSFAVNKSQRPIELLASQDATER